MAKKAMPQLNVSEAITGLHPEIWGDFKNVTGNVSKIFGCITDKRGDVTWLEGDVTLITGDMTNLFGKIRPTLKGDLSVFSGDLTNVIKIQKCAACKKVGLIVAYKKGASFCRDCDGRVCVICKEELTEEEINLLPMYGDPRLRKDDLPTPQRHCTKCYLENLAKNKAREIALIESYYNLQEKHQICSCGKLNDSRNEDGSITHSFCLACRKAYGEKISTDRILTEASLPKNFQNDDRMVVFSRTEGFKHR